MGLTASTPKEPGWLIAELYRMHQAGKLNEREARWILACVYGEAALDEMRRQLVGRDTDDDQHD